MLEPFWRLIEADQLMAYKHEGFWRCMDNLKDRQVLEEMVEQGKMPWRVGDAARQRQDVVDRRPMRALQLARPGETLSVLCLGAHSDDIEIGAGGTILGWIASGVRLEVDWCVLSALGSARGGGGGVGAGVPRRRREQPRSSSRSSRTASFPTRARRSRPGSKACAPASRPTSS